MPSQILDTLRSQLATALGVAYVPELQIAPGISPTIVMGSQEAACAVFEPVENAISGNSTAPVAAAVILASSAFPAGVVDIDLHLSALNATPGNAVSFALRNSAGTVLRAWKFFFDTGCETHHKMITFYLKIAGSVAVTSSNNWGVADTINVAIAWRVRTSQLGV